MLTSIWRDLQYALRTLGRNPGFACVSVLALGLGIGANSAIFTVVNSVLLQPLHFEKPDQLIVVRERNLKAGFPQFSLSPGTYLDFRDHNHSFSSITAFQGRDFNLAGGTQPERLRGANGPSPSWYKHFEHWTRIGRPQPLRPLVRPNRTAQLSDMPDRD